MPVARFQSLPPASSDGLVRDFWRTPTRFIQCRPRCVMQRLFRIPKRHNRRLFSRSYQSLFPQLIYFHIHTKPQGCTLDAFNFSRSVLASASSRVGRRIELLSFCPSYLFRYGGIAGLLLLAGIPANIIPCCENWGAAGITGSRAGDRWEPWQRSIGKSWIGWNVASCN